jgi:hypothetical protein
MQLILIILTKTIRNDSRESFGYGGTTLSNIVANDLTHVSVHAKD